MADNESAIKRILRPAPLVNWALNNFRRADETRKRILRIALNPPRHSLGAVYGICAQIANHQISLEEALVEAGKIAHPRTRVSAREIIPVFHSYASSRQLDGIEELEGKGLPFPIGRAPDGQTLLIPVRPTFVALEDGKLKPYFLIGWSRLAYDDYQKKLISTIICKTLLTEQDYIGSDAQIVCMPKMKWARSQREVREWSARSYGTLSERDLNDQFERYGIALAEVIKELRGD